MSRFAPVVSAVALLALLVTGCTGNGVEGTPGSSGLRDPYFPKAGNGGYDVTHYDLALSYTPGTRHLTARATITARATQDLSAFNLDLQGLKVEEVTVDGTAARFDRAGQELTVRPRDELAEGRTFRATVRYSGTPATITDPDGSQEGWLPTADGALALGQPVGSMAWYPGNHHPSDKATYAMAVTVPEGLRAVSNGEPRTERTTDGRTTSTWHTGRPMASYLTTVAIGRYDISRTVTPDRLPVYTAVDPTEGSASREVLARVPEVLAWAEDLFGPYPFASTGAIVDRAGDAGYALETQTRPVFPGAPDVSLLVHELAHQWFGNSVTPESWQDMWLNEGFATYAEWLWQEDHGGDSAQRTFDELYAGTHYSAPEENAAVWSFPPARPPDAAGISGRPVYDRGAMVLHEIRRTLADDAAFRALLRDWATTHRHGNASTQDFTGYVEERAPEKDFAGVWEQWLYGEGRPERR
ncbi:M1 family metallopeptidase [Streptomyces chromofuscus]|uniref:Aminopeptidase N n=1 Tax=Streptomyces chromofuscus TaxID=42881 RepID=A0A7M2TI29_STRCW|nr:M1 family metallopeptidase [Streptomyces chromofuscus]QOV47348.1 M1 family metallopeptidase [Streptomyces chromofuscus]GGT25252.1 metallopeptidase [Streptomyces chromofuscus]